VKPNLLDKSDVDLTDHDVKDDDRPCKHVV
jgi:hypothetical protein